MKNNINEFRFMVRVAGESQRQMYARSWAPEILWGCSDLFGVIPFKDETPIAYKARLKTLLENKDRNSKGQKELEI